MSGGASVPDATPSPNTPSTTNHRQSPPPGTPAPRWLRLRAPRERPSGGRGKKERPARAAPALRSPPRGPEAAGQQGASTAASGGAGPALPRHDRARRERASRGLPPGLPVRFLALPGPGAPPVGPRTSSCLAALSAPVFGPRWGWRKKGSRKRETGVLKATWWRWHRAGGSAAGWGEEEGAVPRFADFCSGGGQALAPLRSTLPLPLHKPPPPVFPSLS